MIASKRARSAACASPVAGPAKPVWTARTSPAASAKIVVG